MVELTDGTVIRRHLDQLKLNMTNAVKSESEPFTNADFLFLIVLHHLKLLHLH